MKFELLYNTIETKIKEKESLRLKSYDDLAPRRKIFYGDKIMGTVTIGYGLTGGVADYCLERDIEIDNYVADFFLKATMNDMYMKIKDGIKVKLNILQLGAVMLLVYNVGSYAFLKSKTLKHLNASDYDSMEMEWVDFNRVNGVPNQALIKRRHEELDLFHQQPWSVERVVTRMSDGSISYGSVVNVGADRYITAKHVVEGLSEFLYGTGMDIRSYYIDPKRDIAYINTTPSEVLDFLGFINKPSGGEVTIEGFPARAEASIVVQGADNGVEPRDKSLRDAILRDGHDCIISGVSGGAVTQAGKLIGVVSRAGSFDKSDDLNDSDGRQCHVNYVPIHDLVDHDFIISLD